MTKIISIHSFRGGAGKTNLTASLAYLLFKEGKKVAIIDADIGSPGVHVLFGLDSDSLEYTLNDYLWKRVSIDKIVLDVSQTIDPDGTGKLYIIPSSLSMSDIARVLREGYDSNLLIQGFYQVNKDLDLDYLLIDTHSGIEEKTLLILAMCDVLLTIMRPDKQVYQGTSVALEVEKQMDIPVRLLLLNKVLPAIDTDSVKKEIESVLEVPLGGILPFSEEMMLLGSEGIFSKEYPDHPLTKVFQDVLEKVK